jgi:hypothetical protein
MKTGARILWQKYEQQGMPWGSESDIQGYVKDALGDAITAAGLERGSVDCRNELGIFDVRPDIWIVRENRMPIGVVEVKKPNPKIMQSEHVHGQIYDYMLRLRSFFGLQNVFGIVATYESWRVYWLPSGNTDDVANATSLCTTTTTTTTTTTATTTTDTTNTAVPSDSDEEKHPNDDTLTKTNTSVSASTTAVAATAAVGRIGSSSSSSSASSSSSSATLTSATGDSCEVQVFEEPAKDRTLHGSDVVMWNSPTLPLMLCSVVLKMHFSSCDEVKLIDSKRPYISIDQDRWFWSKIIFKPNFTVRRHALPTSKTLVMLADLGGGVDGRVWRACSGAGLGCCIKFARRSNRQDSQEHDNTSDTLDTELANWKALHGDESAQIIIMAKRRALMMPYLDAVSNTTKDVTVKVKEAVLKIADAGLCHNDLHWRHVGKNDKNAIIIFDLAQMKAFDFNNTEVRKAAIFSMLQALDLTEE